MKRLALIILAAALIIPAGAFAMPPHPNVIEKWKKDGTFNENIARYHEMERRYAEERAAIARAEDNNGTFKVSASSVRKASIPTVTGTRVYPVILMEFPGKTESSAWPLSPIATSLLFLALFGAFAPLVFRFRRRGLAHAALVFAIVPGLFALSPRCIGDDSKISFSGTALFDAQSTPEFYKNLFEGSGPTMQQYYEDMSNSKFSPTFDIYGPYTADHSHDYYGRNLYNDNDSHSTALAYEAVRKLIADKDSEVDFSKYDNDNDGKVDGFIVIHQGAGDEADGDPDADNNIWSFMSMVSGIIADGVYFREYSVQPEFAEVPGDSTIGVFCHEFGHILGLPDLYDTSYETEGVGNWSLMAGGSWNGPHDGDFPAPLLAWEREQLGWMTDITMATNGSNTVDDINTTYTAVKVPLHTETVPGLTSYTQYLLVENIVKTGSTSPWTAWLPGEGLLITKIDGWWIENTGPNNTINGEYGTSGDYIKIHGITVIQNKGARIEDGGNTLWRDPFHDSLANGGTENDTFKSGSSSLGGYSGSVWENRLRSTNFTKYTSSSIFPTIGYTESSPVTLSSFSSVSSSMTFTCNGL